MNNYVILTDSAVDLSPEILASWNVKAQSLSVKFTDSDKIYFDNEMPQSDFYNEMRAGRIAKTSAVNIDEFYSFFEEEILKGNDVIYIGFSSGLSSTYNSSRMAAFQLSEKYPERKVVTVDSLAASAGFGLLLYLAVCKKNEGATIEELAKYVEDIRLNICHWFTVDDLEYLKRGGRVSPFVAAVGNALGVKPILHVDNDGHLIKVSTARGRKNSIKALAEMYTTLAENKGEGTIYISHGDCLKDAEALAAIIKNEHGVDTEIITYVGAVIGAHSGPGTLALFFVGKNR